MAAVGGRTRGLTKRARIAALSNSTLLGGLEPAAIAPIADELSEVRLGAGELLFGRGDAAECLFIVVSGELEVVLEATNGDQPVSSLRAGAVIGEIGLLAGDVRSATVRALAPSVLVAVPASGVRRLLAEHPVEAERLASEATQRLRRTQLIDHFVTRFGIIDSELLDAVERRTQWLTLPAGECLFREGEESDAAYLVASGRLRVFRAGPGKVDVEIGEVERGELVGELSWIDRGPRSASVYAVRDTQLMRISREAFGELLERFPSVGLDVAEMALRRSRTTARRDRDRRLSFVVVPVSPGVSAAEFAGLLAPALGDDGVVVTSTVVDDGLGRPGMAQIGDDDVGALRLGYFLEELERAHQHVVHIVDDDWTPWSRRALRWADHVVLVGAADADPAPRAFEREFWSLLAGRRHPKVSLVLLHPRDTELPEGTATWLVPRDLDSHHHVRTGDPEHLARLARLLGGTGTSLVFGGGGARGFAHLGVLAALEDLRTPVDMVGGTSIGAVMAMFPAMGWSAARSRTVALDAFRGLFDYTLPITSVLRGRKITTRLEQYFGHVDLADLWIPYFCVSTNLTQARAEFHDQGPAVQAVRASIAIPGVLPPVPSGGDLLVDGGILDNVPVEEMRRRNPTGRIIAIDVAPTEGPIASRDYGLWVSGFRRLSRRDRTGGPPNLISTMTRSSLIASVRDRQRVVEDNVADLYLDLEVAGGGMLDFSQADHIAASAAKSTRPVLERWLSRKREDHHLGDDGDGGASGTTYVRVPGAPTPIVPSQRSLRGGVLMLTARDLQYRAARFAAVTMGVSVVFTLLFLMTGLSEQFHREPRDTVKSFGASGWLLREGASGAFTSAATMPAATAESVVGVAADPVIIGRHSVTEAGGHTDIVVVGYRSGRLGQPDVRSGRLPSAPGEIVIDDSSDLGLGETAQIGEQRYMVVGLSDRTTLFAGMPLVYMDLGAAQALLYRGQDLATAILLDDLPAAVPEGFIALPPDAVTDDALRPLERSISSVGLIRVLLWFVAAMIIGTMIYLSALERCRDVAVLKAIGGSTFQLGASIALQGVLIALVAAGLASVLQSFVVPVFPLEVTVPTQAFWQVPAVAIVVALAAGVVGLRRAVRTDPALAFSGPGS